MLKDFPKTKLPTDCIFGLFKWKHIENNILIVFVVTHKLNIKVTRHTNEIN